MSRVRRPCTDCGKTTQARSQTCLPCQMGGRESDRRRAPCLQCGELCRAKTGVCADCMKLARDETAKRLAGGRWVLSSDRVLRWVEWTDEEIRERSNRARELWRLAS